MAYITIKYDEGNKSNLDYKYVELHYNDEKKIFNSGYFVKDWYNAQKFITLELDVNHVTYSSSVDHFIMDGAPYDSAYLVNNHTKWELSYDSNDYDKGIEFFVDTGTRPTWEELKKLCE